jgi:hypothetical protein
MSKIVEMNIFPNSPFYPALLKIFLAATESGYASNECEFAKLVNFFKFNKHLPLKLPTRKLLDIAILDLVEPKDGAHFILNFQLILLVQQGLH